MSQTERLYKIRSMLAGRSAFSLREIAVALEVSETTAKRDIAYLRDRLHMPVVYDRADNGYSLLAQDHDGVVVAPDCSGKVIKSYELPGVWFSGNELAALLTMQHLLEALEPSLLSPKLQPLRHHLTRVMRSEGLGTDDIADRVRIVHAGKRFVSPANFAVIAQATFDRKQAQIVHLNRREGVALDRLVSPQRLVHYRDNWYVDTWCHLRGALRSFSIDAIQRAKMLPMDAKEIDPDYITRKTASSYGIFAGEGDSIAVLRFEPSRAAWVSCECWHPKQEGRFDDDGGYLLTVPYSDPRELLADVLKYGADASVLSPPALVTMYRAEVRRAFDKLASP